MRCPECQSDRVRVLDSRAAPGGVRRRRQCRVCRYRWSTIETTIHESAADVMDAIRDAGAAIDRIKEAARRAGFRHLRRIA